MSASEPGIHKGAEVVFEFRVGCQNRENILVPLVQELDGVREGTIPPVVVDAQEPDHGRKRIMGLSTKNRPASAPSFGSG